MHKVANTLAAAIALLSLPGTCFAQSDKALESLETRIARLEKELAILQQQSKGMGDSIIALEKDELAIKLTTPYVILPLINGSPCPSPLQRTAILSIANGTYQVCKRP
jgi:hypothetical protein